MDQCINEMYEILKAEKGIYAEILSLSEKKRDVIIRNDIAELDMIVREEHKMLRMLGEQERRREETLGKIAKVMNADPMTLTASQILEKSSPTTKARFNSIINELSSVLSKQRELNETNKQLIENNLEYINGVIAAVVMGEVKNNTYNVKGNRNSKQQRNIIDQSV